MRDFTKYDVILEARRLAVSIYSLLTSFPTAEKYSLCQQMRRAVISIGANIAEGAGRRTERDFAHFLTQSMGSICELEYLLIVSMDLEYLHESEWSELNQSVQCLKKMLYRFRQSLAPN